jgi:ribosome-binding factor A
MAKSERRSREGSTHDLGFRGQRLEELFREELNSILDTEINDPRLEGIRVTSVDLSRDGARARIWFRTSTGKGEIAAADVTRALDRATGFLRGRLCDALPLKRTPELRFTLDPGAYDLEL